MTRRSAAQVGGAVIWIGLVLGGLRAGLLEPANPSPADASPALPNPERAAPTTPGSNPPDATADVPEEDSGDCPLCSAHPPLPVVTLTADDALAIGKAYSDSNVAIIARIDSLLRAGVFGPSRSGDAQRKAHLLVRLSTLNAYSYMTQFATSHKHIYEASEEALQKAFETFSDPGVYPIAHLTRARMGMGRLCAHYDLSEKMETSTMLGGQRLRVRIDDATVEGRTRRVLIMDLPTGLFSVVEVLMGDHVTADVERTRSDGPPAPYEAHILDHMQGIWVHKWGLHSPRAFVFWVTPHDPMRVKLPERPLTGSRIYVPRIRLKLPSILPTINFEDLREVDLPQPILELSYLREHRYPRWLKPAKMRGFQDWRGVGPLPAAIRQRFPDL